MAHHILYIPGFGKDSWPVQVRSLEKWNKYGLEAQFVPIDWTNSQTFETKLGIVLKKIDALSGPGNKISLIGVSAGASLTLSAYMARKDAVSGVVFICGKLRNPEGVNESYFRGHPAFRESVFTAGANVGKLKVSDKAKMLTVRSFFDGLIPAHDSQIPGVKSRTLPVPIHVPTIFFAITLFRKITVDFLKARAE